MDSNTQNNAVGPKQFFCMAPMTSDKIQLTVKEEVLELGPAKVWVATNGDMQDRNKLLSSTVWNKSM